jgi:hypothetical protein
LSLFQNSVSFEKGFRKIGFKADFSSKSKVDFPKTEVLENPQFIGGKNGKLKRIKNREELDGGICRRKPGKEQVHLFCFQGKERRLRASRLLF